MLSNYCGPISLRLILVSSDSSTACRPQATSILLCALACPRRCRVCKPLVSLTGTYSWNLLGTWGTSFDIPKCYLARHGLWIQLLLQAWSRQLAVLMPAGLAHLKAALCWSWQRDTMRYTGLLCWVSWHRAIAMSWLTLLRTVSHLAVWQSAQQRLAHVLIQVLHPGSKTTCQD